jgi:hypothetical protein
VVIFGNRFFIAVSERPALPSSLALLPKAKGSEVMAKAVKNRWSFAEDRRLIRLAVSGKSLKAIAGLGRRILRSSQDQIEPMR